jgi:hypothetical protein
MQPDAAAKRLSQDAASLLQKNAREQNQDPSLQLANVYADGLLGCIQFDVAHWTVYGTSESSPKLTPQPDAYKSLLLQDPRFPDAPRELECVKDWHHLTQLLRSEFDLASNQAVVYFDLTFNQWMRAFSWDDLDDGDVM